MIDRVTLAAALATFSVEQDDALDLVIIAARERLAQLPVTCERCTGSGMVVALMFPMQPCPTCHGSGKVYSSETVATLERALKECWHGASFRSMTFVVLDALSVREAE